MASANSLADRGHRAVNNAERAVVRGARKARVAGNEVISSLEEAGEDLRHSGEAMVRSVEARIADRPLMSVAIAAVAGFLVAKLWL